MFLLQMPILLLISVVSVVANSQSKNMNGSSVKKSIYLNMTFNQPMKCPVVRNPVKENSTSQRIFIRVTDLKCIHLKYMFSLTRQCQSSMSRKYYFKIILN